MTADPLAEFEDRDRATERRVSEAINRVADRGLDDRDHAEACRDLADAYAVRAAFWLDVNRAAAGKLGYVLYSAILEAHSGAKAEARQWARSASDAEERAARRAVAS